MNAEHLATIHGLYDAMNRRDLAALRALGREHPDFSWESAPDELDTHGRLDPKAAFAYSQELFEVFADVQTEILGTIDLGPDQAILEVCHHVRGAASGAQVERREAHLWTARDGRIVSLREYRTVQEARDAAAVA